MKKLLSIVTLNILVVTILVGCGNEDKISDEDITYQESVVNNIYNDVQDYIETVDKRIECEYKNENEFIDRDKFRNLQKSMRQTSRDLEKIDMSEMKEYYTNENNINKYNELKNKYNQINRSVKYVEGAMGMFKDDVITDDEAMDWICMKEICNSESPLSDEIKDSDEYKYIVEEYGFSLLDKQNEFDDKYGVEDIN